MSDFVNFRNFLDQVMPDDFRRSSAIAVEPIGYEGTAGFDAFVRQRVRDAEHHFNSVEGQVDPMIHLSNAAEVRGFEAYHDETNRDLFARLRREARDMGATMVLVAGKFPAAHRELDLDGLDGFEVREAIDRGDLLLHFGWYAEHRRTGEGSDRRGGLWELVDSGTRLGAYSYGDPKVAPLFHAILD